MHKDKQKSDNSEWKYCTYKLLLGSINFHKILEQSQTHNCQKADIRQVPYPGQTKFRYRLAYLETGACKSLDSNATLPTVVYYASMQAFQIQIRYVFWKAYIVECRMLFRKHEKRGSNFPTIC